MRNSCKKEFEFLYMDAEDLFKLLTAIQNQQMRTYNSSFLIPHSSLLKGEVKI